MFAKEWWKSSLIWIGILTALGSSCDVLVQFIQSGAFDVQSFVGLILGLAVIWRRFKTDTPIQTSH